MAGWVIVIENGVNGIADKKFFRGILIFFSTLFNTASSAASQIPHCVGGCRYSAKLYFSM
jgi:hypothetical protein